MLHLWPSATRPPELEEQDERWGVMVFTSLVMNLGLVLVLLWILRLKIRRNYNLRPRPAALPPVGNAPMIDKIESLKAELGRTMRNPIINIYVK